MTANDSFYHIEVDKRNCLVLAMGIVSYLDYIFSLGRNFDCAFRMAWNN